MDQNKRNSIKFCALCPNPCRIQFPADVLPKESNMSSALAYLAHSIIEGFVEYTPEVRAQLSSLEGARGCREACPYNIDTPALITEVCDELARNEIQKR